MVRATAADAMTVAIAVPDDLDNLVATLTGESALPGTDAGEGHQGERLYVSERLIISPCAGIFELPAGAAADLAGDPASPTATAPGQSDAPTTRTGAAETAATVQVGTTVQIGDLIGSVSGTEVRSPFAGELMGVLAHPGERVQAGQPIAWLRSR